MFASPKTKSINEAAIRDAFKTDDLLDNKSVEIAQDIIKKNYDIATFVEKLGFALKSSTIELRVNGTKLLSGVLANLPSDLLTGGQIEFLSAFYADRMKDQHNVIPAIIDGVTALFDMKNFPSSSVEKVLQSFFQNITCQSQTRPDREKIFKIFKNLSEHQGTALASMGADFISGLIHSLDGERDPRNLEFIFSFMPDLIQRFPLLHLYEEMFEIFASYYPIDFNPSKNDPDAITRDHLARKLCSCMVAAEEFVEWSIPLGLEKLESDLIVAKLDSLELLRETAKKFPPRVIIPHFQHIWPALKQEILPGSDNQEIVHAGLQTLLSILECASADPSLSEAYQMMILGTVLVHLNDIHHRLFDPSAAIALVCVSADAKYSAEKILDTFLLQLHSDQNLGFHDKIKIYSIAAQVFALASLRNAIRQISSNITSQLHAELIKELNKDESPLDLKKRALECLNESIECASRDNRILAYQTFAHLLTSDEEEMDLKSIFKHIAELDPKELQTECVDKIIKNFPLFTAFSKRKILTNFLPLIKLEQFHQIVYNLIFSNIFESSSPEVRLIALEALVTHLQEENSEFIVNLQMKESIIGRIFSLVQSNQLPVDILESCALVLSLIIRHLPVAEQYMIITEYLPKLDLQLTSDLYLTKGLLGFMHESIAIDDKFEGLATDLTNLALNSEDEELRRVCNQLLCSLFNKVEDNEANRAILHHIVDTVKEEIQKNKQQAVEVLSWIGKGLNVRGHEDFGEIMNTIANLLDDPSLNSAAKVAFSIISADFPGIHLPFVKFLFKQKYFNEIFLKAADQLDDLTDIHVNAFVYVLKATPNVVLQMNIEKVGPFLFKCLETDDVNTIEIALEICEDLVKTKDDYFSAHLNHLVPQCLKLAGFQNSMNVRIVALNVLYEITNYPTFILLPMKADVVLALSSALDDPKRLVRNSAVRTSNAWYLVGGPTGEEIKV